MASNNKISYYVDEVCRLSDGRLFIPKMFFQRDGLLWARGYGVEMVTTVCMKPAELRRYNILLIDCRPALLEAALRLTYLSTRCPILATIVFSYAAHTPTAWRSPVVCAFNHLYINYSPVIIFRLPNLHTSSTRSSWESMRTPGLFRPFCSFCWRRIRKYQQTME